MGDGSGISALDGMYGTLYCSGRERVVTATSWRTCARANLMKTGTHNLEERSRCGMPCYARKIVLIASSCHTHRRA